MNKREELVDRFQENLHRVSNYMRSVKDQNDDAYRLGLVFVHSVFEDMLRQLAIFRLEAGKYHIWSDELQLSDGRKVKFTIGELAEKYPKLTLEDLRNQAIARKIQLETFNGSSEVVAYLKLLKFDTTKIEEFLPCLEQSIKRRHKIVHEADLIGTPPEPNPIELNDVIHFVEAVTAVILIVLGSIDDED